MPSTQARAASDLPGEDFAALAKYVKENVRESSLSWDEQDGGGMIITYDPMNMNSEPVTAINSSVYGFYGYFSNINELNGANAILGLPSSDGRGPMIGAYTSVAISAQAYDVDACAEFVKMLISDEVQEELGKSGSFTLNREVFERVGHEAVDYFNENPIDGMYYGPGYGMDIPQNRIKFTYDQVSKAAPRRTLRTLRSTSSSSRRCPLTSPARKTWTKSLRSLRTEYRRSWTRESKMALWHGVAES